MFCFSAGTLIWSLQIKQLVKLEGDAKPTINWIIMEYFSGMLFPFVWRSLSTAAAVLSLS